MYFQSLAFGALLAFYLCVNRTYHFILASILMGSMATAATIDLTGTIRNFKGVNEPGGHPDFEAVIGGLQTGAVDTFLSAGLPVFTGSGKPGFSDAGNFDEWFRDVSGVNQRSTLTITLSNAGTPGVYSYSNANFFPIDNQMFGNTPGWDHNYHFTYDIHSLFGFHGGETLSFTGDDDVWIFINNKLAVDLGGVHSAKTRSLTFDPSTAASFGLIGGNSYSMDLFFAERHTSQSTFNLQTTLDVASPAAEPSSLLLISAGICGLAFTGKRQGII